MLIAQQQLQLGKNVGPVLPYVGTRRKSFHLVFPVPVVQGRFGGLFYSWRGMPFSHGVGGHDGVSRFRHCSGLLWRGSGGRGGCPLSTGAGERMF